MNKSAEDEQSLFKRYEQLERLVSVENHVPFGSSSDLAVFPVEHFLSLQVFRWSKNCIKLFSDLKLDKPDKESSFVKTETRVNRPFSC